MQPLKQLAETLRSLASPEHCVFAPSDLAAAVPGCGQLAVLLSRATNIIHTVQRPDDISGELIYDAKRHLWRASVRQALRDMKATRRSMELVDGCRV